MEDALADVARAIDRAVVGDISIEDFVTAVFVEFRPEGLPKVGGKIIPVVGKAIQPLGYGLTALDAVCTANS